ncbi:H-NS family nucleoid-associated regulatory protein [Paraburkholderia sp. B3]|uniref:H-NS histone family protein n=1 Tax=Paraburkholderia sp. B3 TaxID=3134791 RepID=UPI0039820464
MATYHELKKQLERLNGQAEAARVAEMQAAIDEIQAQIELYELTEHDLFPSSRRGQPIRRPSPKYRDPASGATWPGRGRAPAWILGKKRERFLIEP